MFIILNKLKEKYMPLAKKSKHKGILKKIKSCHCDHWSDFGRKILHTLFGILLVYMIFFLGTLINNNIKKNTYIGLADRPIKTINVTGYAKVNASNDIAVTTLGYSNTDKSVSKAQADNNKVMDKIISELKLLGIDEKDLQTNYSIYPEYAYTSDEGRKFKGYKVTNQVTIKIRNLKIVQDVLALAGKHEANQVSGLSFTIDDTQNLKYEARTKALADAKKKALILAKSLGVRLYGVTAYSEYEGGRGYDYKTFASEDLAGMGAAAPQVVSGSKDVEMNVNITYEIR